MAGNKTRRVRQSKDENHQKFQMKFCVNTAVSINERRYKSYYPPPMDNGHVKRTLFKNHPNNWLIWADGPNKFWGIWGISS